MDLAIIMPWITAALSIIAFLTAIKNLLGSPAKENADKIAKVEQRHDERAAKVESKLIEHDRRIQSVENEMKHLPDREMAHRLELAVEKMNGRLDTMTETLKPIRETTDRMNELLLEQAKR
ncbi:DUF2730 family protein [Rhizobium sp. YJ-22]|uniref:DUF2730 family protein n=1 Tax=Rhizobium sp. YJ-22 TaxID=3037556 RepID=UPI002412E057|nr:DUF2730 family protein [Rhizobium sp. YJ-22]MDG3580401.1 DUF2730 family protein [Rhizobium sp. YJ-22]